MLHAKFGGNHTIGSVEEDFLRVFTIYGCGGHLGHVTLMLRTNFHSPIQGVLEKMFEHCERRTMDKWTPDHGYTISSPMSLWLR